MGVIGKLKVGSGGKLSVKSGKLSVEAEAASSITITLDILQEVPSELFQGGDFRYALGLTNTVTYSSGYLARVDAAVDSDGNSQHTMSNVVIPGGAFNDGVVDCFLFFEEDGFGFTGIFLGITDGAESGQSSPSLSNGRVPLKLAQAEVEVEFEWES